jgi:hypothetical protein
MTAVEAAIVAQRALADSAWRARHPAKAKDERALRKGMDLRQREWGHKAHGTIATHAHASAIRHGALARLYQSGALSADQLAWALEIAEEFERIGAEVSVRTASLETRIDRSRVGDAQILESLGRVRRSVAYSRWRAQLPRICRRTSPAAVLEMIVHDVGIVEAAARFGMHHRTARRVLLEAIDLWPTTLEAAFRDVDDRDLVLVERRLH